MRIFLILLTLLLYQTSLLVPLWVSASSTTSSTTTTTPIQQQPISSSIDRNDEPPLFGVRPSTAAADVSLVSRTNNKNVKEEDVQALNELIFGASTAATTTETTAVYSTNPPHEYDVDNNTTVDEEEEISPFAKDGNNVHERTFSLLEDVQQVDAEESFVDSLPEDRIASETDANMDATLFLKGLENEFKSHHPSFSDTASSSTTSTTTTSTTSSYASSNNNNNNNNNHHESEERLLTPSKAILQQFAITTLYASSESLKNVLTGKVAAFVPADLYGQTLDQEIAACQLTASEIPIPYTDLELESLEILEASTNSLPDSITTGRKLYGGAQYHRTLRNFHHRILTVPIPPATADEISLLVHGISSNVHDGTDLLRSVAKLSSKRMEYLADYLLKEMAQRVEYVLDRMWSVVEYTLLVRNGPLVVKGKKIPPSQYEVIERDLQGFLKTSYSNFVQEQVSRAYQMAREDIFALLRFVSWDLAFAKDSSRGVRGRPSSVGGNRNAATPLSSSSSSNVPGDLEEEEEDLYDGYSDGEEDKGDLVGGVLSRGDVPYTSATDYDQSKTDDILNIVMQSIQAAAPSADNTFAPTCAAINTLVQHVTNRWRMDISNIVMTKFNAFCLLPFHDDFTSFLRKEFAEYLSERSF